MKELVVISGKGGTGKTSLVASFGSLAKKAVLADCDVDAADLHLVLTPTVVQEQDFSGGKRASINPNLCTVCGKCAEVCRFDAVKLDGPGNGGVEKTYRIDPIACEGCGVCVWFCPAKAIDFEPVVNGQWFVSKTRYGPMVHAKLGVAEENSGKLVSQVRSQAKDQAEKQGLELILIDGSPGIGCPVIASITGADLVLIVTEPSLSGLHDLGRVADVAKHFRIPAFVCINKWDINPEVASRIEEEAQSRGLTVVGRVRYDSAVTKAQIMKQPVVECMTDGCTRDIRNVWRKIEEALHLQEG